MKRLATWQMHWKDIVMEWSQIEAKWAEMTRRVQSQAHVDQAVNEGTLGQAAPLAARARGQHQTASTAPETRTTVE